MKPDDDKALFESLNRRDRGRVLHLQAILLEEGYAAGLDFAAAVCWHEAVDRARDAGVGPRRNPDDETGSRLTGRHAAVFRAIDQAIDRGLGLNEPVRSKPGQPGKPVHRATKRKIDQETEKYFTV